MEYYKKYIKYKAKYFQLKSNDLRLLTKYKVDKSDDNENGIVDFDLSNRLNTYEFTGIISCIGIVIRSYSEPPNPWEDLIINYGRAVHLVHSEQSDNAHFMDKPGSDRQESELTQLGEIIISDFENFIEIHNDNKIQIDFITSEKTDRTHISTQFMVNLLTERFKSKLESENIHINNYNIKYHKGISTIEISPFEWGF